MPLDHSLEVWAGEVIGIEKDHEKWNWSGLSWKVWMCFDNILKSVVWVRTVVQYKIVFIFIMGAIGAEALFLSCNNWLYEEYYM